MTFERYLDWESKDNNDLYQIAVFFGENIKWSADYEPIKNTVTYDSIINTLTNLFKEYGFEEYTVRFRNTEYSWKPNFLNETKKNLRRTAFIEKQKWLRKMYYGEFVTSDFDKFVKLYIDFPVEYSYQDILILPKESKILLLFSIHGSIWFISEKMKTIESIAKPFKEVGAIVKYSYKS